MNTAQGLYLVFEVACFGYVGYLFYMIGKNRENQYQVMRQKMINTLKFPDKDGLYYFFALIMVLNVIRVIYTAV